MIDASEEAARRIILHQKLARDVELRSLRYTLWRDDPVLFVNDCVWTFDPRTPEKFLPMVLFPRQEDFIRWLSARMAATDQGIAEKTRDMGLTYCAAAWTLHSWIFAQGFKATFVSRVENLVDKKGDPDCIFEKLRTMLYRLPSWLRPSKFVPREHDSHMKMINPDTGAVITGEGGANAGRGGRSTIYFVDEAAYLEQPRKVEPAISANSDCRIYISTPNGPDALFWKKRFSDYFNGTDRIFTFHWRDDPRKNQAWWEEKKREMDPVDFAREVEIDYSESAEDTLIPMAWVRASVGLDLRRGDEVHCGLDVAEFGSNKNAFSACRGPVVTSVARWGGMDTTQTAHRAADMAEAMGATQLRYDPIGVGAGITGTLMSTDRRMGFESVPVNAGGSPTGTWYDDKPAKKKFVNVRAEMWWELRRRFERTYEYAEKGIEHDHDMMISLQIPDKVEMENLIQQLTMPKYRHTEGGKIKIEAKDQMRRRGAPSPDSADSVAMCMSSAFATMPKMEFGELPVTARGFDW